MTERYFVLHRGRLTVIKSFSRLFRNVTSSTRDLSGFHVSASSPTRSRTMPIHDMDIYADAVPSGSWRPPLMTPPWGATRFSGTTKCGCRRTALLTLASRYERTFTSYIGPFSLLASRCSCRKCCRESGCARILYINARMTVVV